MKQIAILTALWVLTGCVTHTQTSSYVDSDIIPAETVADPQTILSISHDIQRELDQQIQAHWSDRKKLTHLKRFLFHDDGLGIRYDADHTKTALEAYETRSGNCLSIATLFIAAARHVGLPAHYRVVAIEPTWDHQGATMIRYEHIVAHGTLDTGEIYEVDFLPVVYFDNDSAQDVSDHDALAHYFNNLGAEHIVHQDHQAAIKNLRTALAIRPKFADGWNNLGTAYKHAGDVDRALFSYHRALQLNRKHYSSMSNLALLYQDHGEYGTAAYYKRRAQRYLKRNPYTHFFRAQHALKDNKPHQAFRHLQRAIKRNPNEPGFQRLLADIEARIGNANAEILSPTLALTTKPKGGAKAPIRTRIEHPGRNHHRWPRHIHMEAFPGAPIPVCDTRGCT
ncbi:MAG: tetratricopeptide repeat protein [Pseudomonadota bacterium]